MKRRRIEREENEEEKNECETKKENIKNGGKDEVENGLKREGEHKDNNSHKKTRTGIKTGDHVRKEATGAESKEEGHKKKIRVDEQVEEEEEDEDMTEIEKYSKRQKLNKATEIEVIKVRFPSGDQTSKPILNGKPLVVQVEKGAQEEIQELKKAIEEAKKGRIVVATIKQKNCRKNA